MNHVAGKIQLGEPTGQVDSIGHPGDSRVHEGLIQTGLVLQGIANALFECKKLG
jgi:hypothetical protein